MAALRPPGLPEASLLHACLLRVCPVSLRSAVPTVFAPVSVRHLTVIIKAQRSGEWEVPAKRGTSRAPHRPHNPPRVGRVATPNRLPRPGRSAQRPIPEWVSPSTVRRVLSEADKHFRPGRVHPEQHLDLRHDPLHPGRDGGVDHRGPGLVGSGSPTSSSVEETSTQVELAFTAALRRRRTARGRRRPPRRRPGRPRPTTTTPARSCSPSPTTARR